MLSIRMHWLLRFTFNWMCLQSQQKGTVVKLWKEVVNPAGQKYPTEREMYCHKEIKDAHNLLSAARYTHHGLVLYKLRYRQHPFSIKDGIRFSFCCLPKGHPPSPTASSHCVESGTDAEMETIKGSCKHRSPFQKHSFSRPSAAAAAQEAFPDFTTTEQQFDGVYAWQDPTSEETRCSGAPQVMFREKAQLTMELFTALGLRAHQASPLSCLLLFFQL